MNRLWWLIPLLCVSLTGCWFSLSPTTISKSARKSTGTLGRYQFASKSDVKTFNSKVVRWFQARGYNHYSHESDKTFDEILGENGKSWKGEAGQLLYRHYDAENREFVFVPDCHRPDQNIQVIAFHVEYQGDGDRVSRFTKTFETEEERFHKAFPSTAEPKP
jgi:hypothetical protein